MVITDSGSPALSSTTTFTISVCVCQSRGDCPSSGIEALALTMGVSLQALLGLSICFITIIGMIYKLNMTKNKIYVSLYFLPE